MNNFLKSLESVLTVKMRPYWTDVRSLSNSSAVRLSILVPLIGYWIILNDHIVSEYAKLSCFIVDCPKQPTPMAPWRLFATFFGLSLLGLGSFIYQVCCPRVVKDYPDATAYGRSYVRDISGTEIDRVEAYLLDDPETAARAAAHREYAEKNVAAGHAEFGDDGWRHDLWRNFLQEHFDVLNARRYPARVVCYAFYVLGFAILAYPTLDVFARVFRVLWKAISA